MADLILQISEAVITGDDAAARTLTQQALAEGLAPQSIFSGALIPGMDEVGRRMATEEYFLPEVLLSCRAVKAASAILKPLIVGSQTVKPMGRVLIGAVQGDLHDIGKNLVAMMFEGTGFEVIDLGVDVPAARFIEEVKKTGADILALSALLTLTMDKMVEVLELLSSSGCRQNLIVLVGGAPVDEAFAHKIGADGYAADAGSAARLAKQLIAARSKRQD